jgi:hypothetical protein
VRAVNLAHPAGPDQAQDFIDADASAGGERQSD